MKKNKDLLEQYTNIIGKEESEPITTVKVKYIQEIPTPITVTVRVYDTNEEPAPARTVYERIYKRNR